MPRKKSIDELRLTDERRQLAADNVPLALYMANRRFGRHPDEDLDELVSEASFRLVAAARAFRPDYGVPFGTYAGAAIDRRFKELARERYRHRVQPSRDPEQLAAMLQDHREAAPGAGGIASEVWRRAMRVLRPREREVVELRYVDRLTVREAGERMRMSYQNVQQIEARLLNRLRRYFGVATTN